MIFFSSSELPVWWSWRQIVHKPLLKAGSANSNIKARVHAHTHMHAHENAKKPRCVMTGCDCQHAPPLTHSVSLVLSQTFPRLTFWLTPLSTSSHLYPFLPIYLSSFFFLKLLQHTWHDIFSLTPSLCWHSCCDVSLCLLGKGSFYPLSFC